MPTDPGGRQGDGRDDPCASRFGSGTIPPVMATPSNPLGMLFRAPAARLRWVALLLLVVGALAGLFVDPSVWNRIRGPLPEFPTKAFRLGLDLQGGSHLVYEADMQSVPEADRREQLNGLREVIERRVNAFGVSEPLVQTAIVGDKYRLIVDLAGILDVNEAIRQIGETPLLEFKEVSTEPARPLTAEEKKQLADSDAEAKKKAQDALKRVREPGADFAALAKELSDDPGSKDNGGDLDWFTAGTTVPEFETAVAALKVDEISKTPVATAFGYHIIKKTGEREAAGPELELSDGTTATSTVPEYRASHILFKKLAETDIVPPEQWKNSGLTGAHLRRANVLFDQQTGVVQIGLQFNDEGTKLFGEITKRNVGKPVAIFLDGVLLSDPVVQQEILVGEAVITGRYTIPEAKQMVRNLNAGALPVPITLVNQQTVGASLGAESLAKSLMAGLLGFAVVALFMFVIYRFLGVVATVALVVYAALTLAVFKMIGVTLTLAGIAGFILSLGMAVDANILIFERMKEELRSGKAIRDAMDEGFRRAWLSIRDSNASSLITCAILAWLGTSLVKGFAVTLAIGILVSMFTAIIVTRTFLRALAGRWMEKHLWIFGVAKRS
ncbi:protein translocase subunit SecD [Patescibacteria group bacterium]|nr:MAG: protein translocase subunit SecD [Patescibacteria group bacterium]